MNLVNATTTLTESSSLTGGRPCSDGSGTCNCVSYQSFVTNSSRGMLSDEGSLDALLYIVVVLFFYAFSIVVLMVKYIRRENKEAYLRQYFEEFVAREQFQSAKARNQMCVKNIMKKRGTDLKQFRGQLETGVSSEKQVMGKAAVDIPPTISELTPEHTEHGEPVAEYESPETGLLTELAHTDSFEMENEQAPVSKELLPRRETPV